MAWAIDDIRFGLDGASSITWLDACNTSVVDVDKSNKIIISIFFSSSDHTPGSKSVKPRWRNKTDNPTGEFADFITGSGEVRAAASAGCITNTDAVGSSAACQTSSYSEEIENESPLQSQSFSPAKSEYIEIQCCGDISNIGDGKEIEIELWDVTGSESLGIFTYTLTTESTTPTEASLSISQALGVSPAGQGNMMADLGISQIMAQGQGGQANAFDAISISILFSQTQSGGLTILADMALSQIMAVLAASQREADGSLSIIQNMGVSTFSNAVGEGLLNLTKTLAMSAGAEAHAYALISIAHQLATVLTGQIEGAATEAAMSLAQSWAASLSAQANVQADAQLQNVYSIAAQSAALAAAAISLSHQLAQSQQGSSIIAAQIATALQAGIGITANLTIEAGVDIFHALGLSKDAQADMQAQLNIAQTHACVVIGQSLATAGISVDAVHSVMLSGDLVIAEITTPDGRMAKVRLEIRIKEVSAENRIHEVRRY